MIWFEFEFKAFLFFSKMYFSPTVEFLKLTLEKQGVIVPVFKPCQLYEENLSELVSFSGNMLSSTAWPFTDVKTSSDPKRAEQHV